MQTFVFASPSCLASPMGGKKAKKHLSGFTEKDTEILIRIVKTAQGRKIRGSKGDWKEFLKATDKKLGSTVSDPGKRSWETLAAFVQTFTAEDAIQMVREIKSWEKRCKKIEQGLWEESAVQELVELTRQHGRYKESYTFPSYSEGWVMIDLGKGDDPIRQEEMLSIDCEMVVCENGEKELVHVCVVNRDCKMVLDMLVKPTKPVVDYLTAITGVSEANLEGVTSSFHDAQKAILKLLTSSTILVGHSLHHDLKALKIDHQRVIDISFIFKYCNKPESYIAGLNDLCKAVLGYEFRQDSEPHNCLDDAIIPMRIILHTLQHGLKSPIDISRKMLDEVQLSKLYFHSIPKSVSVNDLQDILPKNFSCEIEAISWMKHKFGTTFAVFRSSDEANKAFKELKGRLGKDSYGRPQKLVSFSVLSKLGKLEQISIRVRKMSSDDPDDGDGRSDPEGDSNAKTTKASDCITGRKRTKNMCEVSQVNAESEKGVCCSHLEELENLQRQVRERDGEIHSLQRIIVALTRREDL